jgi:spoIIIJ-associated protein
MSEPRFVEATGQDVETAIKNGLARLGASSKDVIVEVLEESSRGIFGLGGKPAKVRLTLLAPVTPPPPPPPPQEAAPPPAAAPSRQEPEPTPERQTPRERPVLREKQPWKEQQQQEQASQAKPAAQEKPDRKSGERKSRDRRSSPRSERKPAADAVAESVDDVAEPARRAPAPDDEEARVAIDTLVELLGKMQVQAKVDAYYVEAADENEESPLVLQVTGKDLGMLIGRRGDTLKDLQYITRLIVSRELQRRANLVVDVEQYKLRRERRLRSLALRMAKQATQRDRTVTLEPMAAYERRIIHLTLRDRTDVYTQSVGEGDGRKVTIVPVRDR